MRHEYYHSSIGCLYDYPFGMLMPNRTYTAPNQGYGFGFQGQECDINISGNGNSYTFKYRMHDSRLGRFFSVDPLEKEYPWNSTYAFAENSVIRYIELEGAEKYDFMLDFNVHSKRSQLTLIKTTDIKEMGIVGYTALSKESNILVPIYETVVNARQEYTVNGVVLPFEFTNKLLVPMTREELVKNIDVEIVKYHNDIIANNEKIAEIETQLKEIDKKMQENRDIIGDPDQGDPKTGLEIAKLLKNADLSKKWNELVSDRIKIEKSNKELGKTINELTNFKETVKP